MNKVITILSILICTTVCGQNGTKRVLFLGNSYTSVNNLPQAIADVAGSVGDTLIFDSYTPGGYYLGNHATDSVSLGKIKMGHWDYMVLQDQSLALAYPSTFKNMIQYARTLDSIRKDFNACGQTMFYITWGRKNGDTYLCTPPECDTNTWITRTYFEMDSVIQLNYMFVADSLKALAAPVGAVWRYIRHNFPAIELFQADESHPSEAGTYAAACCFYTAIFRKDPTSISFNSTLSITDATDIKNTAKLIVFDSLLNWNIGKYDSLLNDSCFVLNINEESCNLLFHMYPNPVSDNFTIEASCFAGMQAEKSTIEIFNIEGQIIKSINTAEKQTTIDLRNLSNGVYIIKAKTEKGVTVMKLIKQ